MTWSELTPGQSADLRAKKRHATAAAREADRAEEHAKALRAIANRQQANYERLLRDYNLGQQELPWGEDKPSKS